MGYVGPFGWVIIETFCKNSERQAAVNYFHRRFSSETFQEASNTPITYIKTEKKQSGNMIKSKD